jgi:pyruvate/2-oxoglutarate dehydrogenase complex dihydrolipoamide dehydrogenase (E3) component
LKTYDLVVMGSGPAGLRLNSNKGTKSDTEIKRQGG